MNTPKQQMSTTAPKVFHVRLVNGGRLDLRCDRITWFDQWVTFTNKDGYLVACYPAHAIWAIEEHTEPLPAL